MTLHESLKKYTTVVADTGDIEAIHRHRPQDAPTNPSLLYNAAQMPAYRHLVEEAAEKASDLGGSHDQMAEEFIDQMFVLQIVYAGAQADVQACDRRWIGRLRLSRQWRYHQCRGKKGIPSLHERGLSVNYAVGLS